MPDVFDITGTREADLALVASLVSVSKQTRSHLAIRLAHIGLKPGEDDIVCGMEDGKTKSVAHLASKLNISFSTTVKCLADLEQRGYVFRVVGPLVRLSESGTDLSVRIAGTRVQVARDLRKSVGRERFAEISSMLVDLEKALSSTAMPLG